MTSKIGDGVRAQEYATLKVPYEMLNKKFRLAQKSLDREANTLNGCFKEVETMCSKPDAPSKDIVVKMLTSVIEKLRSAKRKASEALHDEERSAKLCKRRVSHLKEHASPDQVVVEKWKNDRFYRMMIEHLLHSGFYDTALNLAEQHSLQELVNSEVFISARKVEKSLERKDLQACLEWCNENKSKLRKNKSQLEFTLRLQQFVEIIKKNDFTSALNHAKKHFTGIEKTDNRFIEVKKAMGLLVFAGKPLDTIPESYAYLLSENRWESIKENFRSDNYKLHQLGENSIFKITLQAGLSGLKTHQCYDNNSKSLECPVCCPLFNKLALPLPFAHCAQSRIVCRITGELMADDNMPMVLPNGYVYGKNGLNQITKNDEVICPRTGNKYKRGEVEKLFVM